MALSFSPRDAAGLSAWLSADASQVSLWAGTSNRVAKWNDKHSGDFPYVANDHGEANQVALYRVPSLTASGFHGLNGKPTIACSEGQYLMGRTMGWTANDSGTYDPAWYDDLPGSQYPEGRTPWEMLPANNHHAFLLCRFLPPATVGPSDSIWTGTLRTQLGFVSSRQPRPAVWMPDLSSRSTPGIDINDWNPASPTAPGSLRFFISAVNTFKNTAYAPVVVPFSSFGQWTLLEIVSRPASGELRINGVSVSQIERGATYAPYSEPDYRPCFFAASNLGGAWAYPELCNGGGSLAEHLVYKGELSTDDAHKVRAWILRRWGLGSLLPSSNPYRNGEIPGADEASSTAFPGLRPSSRTYTPGNYPNTAFGSIGGLEQRVRHSSTGFGGDRLSLEFKARSEADAEAVLSHYAGRQGTFKTFGLHPDLLVNLGPVARHLGRQVSRAELAPKGASWVYASPPEIQDQQLNINTLSVELELVREPIGLTISGDIAEAEVSNSSELGVAARRFAGVPTVEVVPGDMTLDYGQVINSVGGTGIVEAQSDVYMVLGRVVAGEAAVTVESTDRVPDFFWGNELDGEAVVSVDAPADLLWGQAIGAEPATVKVGAPLGWDLVGSAQVSVEGQGDLAIAAAPDWTVESQTGAPFLGSASATSTTGWTQILSSKADDSFVASGPLTFDFKIAGTVYTSCFIGSNGYVTFGSGGSTANVSASNPSVPKVLFFAGDRATFRVFTRVGGSGIKRFFKVRWEGSADWSSSASDSYVEITLFQQPNASYPQYIEVRYGTVNASSQLRIASSSSYYAQGPSGSYQGTSYVLTGTANGTSWAIDGSKRIAHAF